MKQLHVVALVGLVLSGCTGTHIKPPAVCDGKHRRPANLYGSILPTLPVPLPPSQSALTPSPAPAAPDTEPPGTTPATGPVLLLEPESKPPVTPAPPTNSEQGTHPGAVGKDIPPAAGPTSRRDITMSYLPC